MVLEQSCAWCLPVEIPSKNTHNLLQNIHLTKICQSPWIISKLWHDAICGDNLLLAHSIVFESVWGRGGGGRLFQKILTNQKKKKKGKEGYFPKSSKSLSLGEGAATIFFLLQFHCVSLFSTQFFHVPKKVSGGWGGGATPCCFILFVWKLKTKNFAA